jgi:hypothetical protein
LSLVSLRAKSKIATISPHGLRSLRENSEILLCVDKRMPSGLMLAAAR